MDGIQGGRRMPVPDIKARLRAGIPVISLGVRQARTGDIARIAHGAGYHCIWIDIEHSSMSFDVAAQIASTASDLGLAAWVRVPERDIGSIGRMLDGGATGIISPKVETAEEALAVAAACRFAPTGVRSAIALLPQFGFVRMPAGELARRADAAVVVQILIESALGVANADAIAAVDGVDLLGIGMNDLTADLGCPGDVGDPRVVDACRRVAAAAARHGKLAVVGGVADPDRFVALLGEGFAPLIFAGIDTDILAQGMVGQTEVWGRRLAHHVASRAASPDIDPAHGRLEGTPA